MKASERIKECEVEIKNIKYSYDKVWQQVSNEIPHQIMELDKRNEESHQRIYDKLDKIIWYIAIGLVATTAVGTLVQLLIK